MNILPLTLADCANAASLHQQTFPRGWTEDSFQDFLKDPLVFGLKIEGQSTLLGYILWREVLDEAEILTLVVAENHRQKGLGTQLLTNLCSHLREKNIHTLFLEVAEDNSNAVSFYRKHGFNFISKRSNYYPRTINISVSALNFSKKII